jgi:hypothetical protein
MSVAGHGDGIATSHGLEGSARARTSHRAPAGPTAPAPTGTGSGNGGDGATGGGTGGFGGAAALGSQTFVDVPSATVALRTFARSRAPEPFLLLLEQPG